MRFVFISTMTGYQWGGSEELWSQAALRLRIQDHEVSAIVEDNLPRSIKFDAITSKNISLRIRKHKHWALAWALWTRLTGQSRKDTEMQWVAGQNPHLVVISQGGIADGLIWMEFCSKKKIPFVSIVQSNNETVWPKEIEAVALAEAYKNAKRIYCVSKHNKQLLEWQVGEELPNAQVVWNPNNASKLKLVPWPAEEKTVRLACVARLDPGAKGQDILLQVMALPQWRKRIVELNLYGVGPTEKILRKMAKRLQLTNVRFRGHVNDLIDIWKENHLLILPSRHEGMPLALIEAMSCGRPAVVTNVGGNAELCKNMETGFIANAPSLESLTETLEHAWMHRSEWEKIGFAAHKRIFEIIPRDPIDSFVNALLFITKLS